MFLFFFLFFLMLYVDLRPGPEIALASLTDNMGQG